MAQATVVGAGVAGLTTAIALERAGYEVTVVAKEKGLATTSGVAGAVWLPYRVGPPSRALDWARRTREELVSIAERFPDAGVDLVDAFLAAESVPRRSRFEPLRAAAEHPKGWNTRRGGTPGEVGLPPLRVFPRGSGVAARPWWASAAGELALVDDAPGMAGVPCWKMRVPRCDPRLYLPWLEAMLHRPVVLDAIDDLDRVIGDCIVNCTGLGARTLARDSELEANLGQTVVVASETLDPTIMVSDDRDPDAMSYVIPRRGEFVLGGCSIPIDNDVCPAPDRLLGEAIVDRCRRFGFESGRVLYAQSGLRPVRAEVRLERAGRVIHNYGHGGAGYSLSWGCADEVVRLAAAS